MPLHYVSGDPLLSRVDALAFGHNLKGKIEVTDFETALMNHNPTAFAGYRRRCKGGYIHTGGYWVWRDDKPQLVFLTVRNSSVGATRLRYVQTAAMTLARDYWREGWSSLAIAPLGSELEWQEIKLVLETWLIPVKLNVIVYDVYLPGIRADEP